MRQLCPVAGKVAVSGVAGLVEVGCTLAFIWTSKHVVDIATGASDGSLGKGVALFVAIIAIQVFCRVFASYWQGLIVVRTQNESREKVFAHVMRSTWTGREKFHSGDTVNRLEQDISTVTDFLCVNLPEFLITLVQLVAATVYLFMLAPKMAWVLIFIMPAAVLGSMLFFRKMRRLTGEIRAVDSKIQGHIQENLQHRVLILTLQGAEKVMEKLGWLQTDVENKTIKRLNYGAVARGFMQFGFSAGYAVAFLWGVFGLRDGSISYGTMVAFLSLVGQVQRPVANMTRHIPAFIRALSSQERLMELSEMPLEDCGEDVVFPLAPGVLVSGLSYAYPDSGRMVFEGLDFDFKPGTMTAVVGPTGAGKSTLIRVILALLEPSDGSVSLYGDGFKVRSGVRTRCNFMYVPQGNSLMSGTIRENLLLGRPDATEEDLRNALHLAAADFVFSLPDALETACSEVGSGLSEGQAQRIAVARSLLRPGGVLILDEATSSLDAETELELLERLSAHYKGTKTIICITHRPAATSYADAVLRLG